MTSRGRTGMVLGIMGLVLMASVVVATALGSVALPLDTSLAILLKRMGIPVWTDINEGHDAIVFMVRLPRVLGAVLIGASLAVAGTVMQGTLRNPMADPGIIGVSAGAGFGAVVAIALGFAAQWVWAIPLSAAAGSLAATFIIFFLSSRGGTIAMYTLILSGLAVGTFFGAGTSLVLTYASHDSIAQFIFWAMGNLYNLRWESLALVTIPLCLGTGVLLGFAKDLNLLLLGEEEAGSLGLNVARTRVVLLILVSVTTAAAVSVSGPIGFVGLIVPHMLRFLVGPDHRVLLPAAALGGAIFLVLCDLVARLALGAQEVNVGIVTSLLGAPYFVFLLLRSRKREAS